MAKSKKHKELEELIGIEIEQKYAADLYEMYEALNCCDKEVLLKNVIKLLYKINLIERNADSVIRIIYQ